MLRLSKQEIREYLLVSGAYFLLSLIFFWPILQNVAAVVPGSGGDTYQSLWELWWTPYSLLTLHASPYTTSYIFYPIGASLATQTLAPLAGLFSVIFQLISLPFAYNIIFLLGFVLSGLFTYILAHHFTKHRKAAFVAGMIFAFSPIHTIQAFGHLQFTNIEFIPLFLFFLIKMTEERKLRYALLAAVSFVLLTFMGDIEQGLMAILLAIFLVGYMAFEKSHRHKVLTKDFFVLVGQMCVAILIIGSPFFIGILGALNGSSLSTVNSQADTSYNLLYSPDFLSFFAPSSFNGLLGWISSGLPINYAAPSESTVYAGYSVLALAAAAIYFDRKEKYKETAIFAVPLAIFFLLSLGPYLQIGGGVTGIPSLYLIYHAIPFFNVLREPGRFDIVIELMLAMLAAIGLSKLEAKASDPNTKKYLAAIFVALIMLEYNSWPTSAQMMKNMYTQTQIPAIYSQIGALKGNFSMLVLPALPNYTNATPELYPGLALYYQTAFKHPLVGGYSTRSNTTQLFSLANMPLIASSYYVQLSQGLVYGSPIKENYTNASIFLLGAYNVGFVSLNTRAYNRTGLQQLVSYLSSFLGYPIYQNISANTIVFRTANITAKAGSSIVSYTPVILGNPNSVWQTGYVLCGSTPNCPITTPNMWFFRNPAFLTIFAPTITNINMSFQGLSPNFAQATFYLPNQQHPILVNFTPTQQKYSMKFQVTISPSSPISQILIIPSNANGTAYSNIGINNITFKKYS